MNGGPECIYDTGIDPSSSTNAAKQALSDVVSTMLGPSGLSLKNKSHGVGLGRKKITDCFSGEDCFKWAKANGLTSSTTEIERLGAQLIEHEYIYAVTSKHSRFASSHALYKWNLARTQQLGYLRVVARKVATTREKWNIIAHGYELALVPVSPDGDVVHIPLHYIRSTGQGRDSPHIFHFEVSRSLRQHAGLWLFLISDPAMLVTWIEARAQEYIQTYSAGASAGSHLFDELQLGSQFIVRSHSTMQSAAATGGQDLRRRSRSPEALLSGVRVGNRYDAPEGPRGAGGSTRASGQSPSRERRNSDRSAASSPSSIFDGELAAILNSSPEQLQRGSGSGSDLVSGEERDEHEYAEVDEDGVSAHSLIQRMDKVLGPARPRSVSAAYQHQLHLHDRVSDEDLAARKPILPPSAVHKHQSMSEAWSAVMQPARGVQEGRRSSSGSPSPRASQGGSTRNIFRRIKDGFRTMSRASSIASDMSSSVNSPSRLRLRTYGSGESNLSDQSSAASSSRSPPSRFSFKRGRNRAVSTPTPMQDDAPESQSGSAQSPPATAQDRSKIVAVSPSSSFRRSPGRKRANSYKPKSPGPQNIADLFMAPPRPSATASSLSCDDVGATISSDPAGSRKSSVYREPEYATIEEARAKRKLFATHRMGRTKSFDKGRNSPSEEAGAHKAKRSSRSSRSRNGRTRSCRAAVGYGSDYAPTTDDESPSDEHLAIPTRSSRSPSSSRESQASRPRSPLARNASAKVSPQSASTITAEDGCCFSFSPEEIEVSRLQERRNRQRYGRPSESGADLYQPPQYGRDRAQSMGLVERQSRQRASVSQATQTVTRVVTHTDSRVTVVTETTTYEPARPMTPDSFEEWRMQQVWCSHQGHAEGQHGDLDTRLMLEGRSSADSSRGPHEPSNDVGVEAVAYGEDQVAATHRSSTGAAPPPLPPRPKPRVLSPTPRPPQNIVVENEQPLTDMPNTYAALFEVQQDTAQKLQEKGAEPDATHQEDEAVEQHFERKRKESAHESVI